MGFTHGQLNFASFLLTLSWYVLLIEENEKTNMHYTVEMPFVNLNPYLDFAMCLFNFPRITYASNQAPSSWLLFLTKVNFFFFGLLMQC